MLLFYLANGIYMLLVEDFAVRWLGCIRNKPSNYGTKERKRILRKRSFRDASWIYTYTESVVLFLVIVRVVVAGCRRQENCYIWCPHRGWQYKISLHSSRVNHKQCAACLDAILLWWIATFGIGFYNPWDMFQHLQLPQTKNDRFRSSLLPNSSDIWRTFSS